jgi:predicted transcriptional regulator of viral defense system
MTEAKHPPVGARLSYLADAQHGYFTRSQAVREGVDDMDLQRAVSSGAVVRLGHGVYRIAGAGQDVHQQLRVAWLRLTADLSPRERTIRPHLWVSHRSAASLLNLGVAIADVPEFISDRRIQTRAEVKVRVRSEGLKRGDWTVADGFAVTTPARTISDLAADRLDGGHLGRIASDALTRNLISETELESAVGGKAVVTAILEQATGGVV